MANYQFLKSHPEGVTLALRIKTKSSRKGLLSKAEELLDLNEVKWGVSAAPVDGAANDELLSSVAKFFGLRCQDVDLLVGKTSKSKVILLRGVTLSALSAKLAI